MYSDKPVPMDDNALAAQRDNHQYELAKLSIQAKREEEGRYHETYLQTKRIMVWFAGFCFTVFMLFLAYVVHAGKTDLATELIKTAGLLLGGGGTGYVLGYKKGFSRSSN